ncbi:MAG TPA: hypothetical protein VGT05_03210 [Patescibacteria group bacterium]|nr:hypothetical protein [Patescibacteria group bacterium]
MIQVENAFGSLAKQVMSDPYRLSANIQSYLQLPTSVEMLGSSMVFTSALYRKGQLPVSIKTFAANNMDSPIEGVHDEVGVILPEKQDSLTIVTQATITATPAQIIIEGKYFHIESDLTHPVKITISRDGHYEREIFPAPSELKHAWFEHRLRSLTH